MKLSNFVEKSWKKHEISKTGCASVVVNTSASHLEGYEFDSQAGRGHSVYLTIKNRKKVNSPVGVFDHGTDEGL